MQITTTAIKHKRFSTYGWNFTENGIYKNTLSQGEIGILLGHRYEDGSVQEVSEKDSGLILNCILELRIGTEPDLNGKASQQYFFDAMPIDIGSYGVRTLPTLPNFGRENCLYIRTSDNTAHFWNGNQMVPLAGGSGSDIQTDLSNYVTQAQLNDYKAEVAKEIGEIKTNLAAVNKISAKNALDITSLSQKIAGLEGTTYFLGAGPDASKPAFVEKNGAIWVATDTSKEYIWVNNSWVELGDVTEEAKQLTNLKDIVEDLTSQMSSKANSDQVAQDIADAKTQVLSGVSEITSELQDKIEKNTAKFDSYYSKEETENLISDSLNNIEIDEINGNKEFPLIEDEDK